MKNGQSVARRVALLYAAAAALLPQAAHAQGSADAWQWRASIYGWFPSISGSTRFPTGGGGPSIDVDSDAILDALKMTFMGALDVRKGSWGLFNDLLYVDLGDSKSASRDFAIGQAGVPAGVDLNADLDLKTWAWTFAGSYAIVDTPQNTTQLLFGGRMLSLEQKLDWSFNGDIGPLGLPGRSGSAEVDKTYWDAIVGLKGVAGLSADRRWVLPYYVDVGTGQSRLTWQAMAGIGYSFDWGTTTLAWRYLDYEFDPNAAIQDVSLSGPFLGVTFRW
jgi:hypothetical protein